MPDSLKASTSHDLILERPRIDTLLERAFLSPLVVLYAGPGCGKTTSLAQYLDKRDDTVAWFSFAEPDNTPALFWAHLSRLFSQHVPGFGEKMQTYGFPDTTQKYSQFISDLTHVLYRDENSVVFVFDNVDVVTDAAVLAFIEKSINARMENCSIVLLTRTWPLFSEQLSVIPQVISALQLRYTHEEAAAYFKLAGLNVPQEEVNEINTYISGWPIALSLVCLAIKNRSEMELSDLPASTELSHAKPALFALFEEQIFAQYTAKEQKLLIELAALNSFPRGLVRAVTGEQERDINQLLNDNIFIHYDAKAERLSCHPLYLEFLREKLRGIEREKVCETYQKAGDWCLENGHYHDAVEYYQNCDRYEQLWETLLRIERPRQSYSEAEFFIEQIQKMPEDFKVKNPMTRLVLAMMLGNNLRFDEASEVLDVVEAQLFKNGKSRKAAGDSTEGNPGDDEALNHVTSAAVSSHIVGEYYLVRGLQGFAHEDSGYEEYFEKAAELLPQGSSHWDSNFLLIDLGPAVRIRSSRKGALQKHVASLNDSVPAIAKAMNGAGKGLDSLSTCEALFLTGNFKEALDPAYEAFYAADTVSQYDILANALFMLLRIYIAQGKYDMVVDTLQQVERYETTNETRGFGMWDIIRGWFLADAGEVENVAYWIRSPMHEGFAPLSLDRPMTVRMRCLISDGQFSEALALLVQFEEMAKRKNAVITLIYIYLGRAVSCNALGRYEEAAQALKAAYELAKDNEIYMPFIEYGNRTRSLVERVQKIPDCDIPEAWLKEMYTKANTYAKRQAYVMGRYRQEHGNTLLNITLSQRETELLTNISQGLTREETAEAMLLSLSTVKSLTKQVFAKLGAINTADAVRIGIANRLI